VCHRFQSPSTCRQCFGPRESYNGGDATLALKLDQKIRNEKKADWRGNRFKEQEVRNAIASVLGSQVRETDTADVETVMELVRNQSDY